MTEYYIIAECYFPINHTSKGERITGIKLDKDNNVLLTTDTDTNPFPQGLLSPSQIKVLSDKQSNDKIIEIEKYFESKVEDLDQSDILNAVAEIENFISWLSYLTLRDYRILKWGEVTSLPICKESSTLFSVGQKFNLPVDTPLVQESTKTITVSTIEPPIFLENFETLLSISIPSEIKSALRWYRKGLLSYFPEEKQIFWVTALEIISGLLSKEAEIINECKVCGNITSIRPSVNKSALFEFIKELGFSKNKTYNVIQKFRNKYAHGGESNYEYGSKDINIVINATKSLIVLFISLCINSRGLLPSEYLKEGYEHIIYGKAITLTEPISILENSGLHKKSKL